MAAIFFSRARSKACSAAVFLAPDGSGLLAVASGGFVLGAFAELAATNLDEAEDAAGLVAAFFDALPFSLRLPPTCEPSIM